jgi:hypothetical protein
VVCDVSPDGVTGAEGASGQGTGGGLGIHIGARVSLASSSKVIRNNASTRADDIFGTDVTMWAPRFMKSPTRRRHGK